MVYEEITWHCDGHALSVGLDRTGSGPVVLMLPALSSISTRCEMHPLQERLAGNFTVITVDWPGFGKLRRPPVDWRPEIYAGFLNHLLEQVVVKPYALIAAGHAAGYVLRHFAGRDCDDMRLVLMSPTWRGPLPTMLGGSRGGFARIVKAVDLPLLGPLLYRLNVNRLVVRMMARGHVYAERDWLRGRRLTEKLAVTRAEGARHASVRFVCGRLDPFASREHMIDTAERGAAPMLQLFSISAPRRSRAEMEALAAVPGLATQCMPAGKLSFYEEFPERTAAAIQPFLSNDSSQHRESA
jgi:pimeloyl-ACP methyl ester carboxylesterase